MEVQSGSQARPVALTVPEPVPFALESVSVFRVDDRFGGAAEDGVPILASVIVTMQLPSVPESQPSAIR